MPVLNEDTLPSGFSLLPGLLGPQRRRALMADLETLPAGAAGQREVLERPWCRTLASRLLRLSQVRRALAPGAVAVQCTLFEKSPERNWLVAMHQDLAVPVASRVEHPALQGWSVKNGRLFVLAPAELLAQMVALRLHLDDATQAHGGLRFVPGSHRKGVLDDAAMCAWRGREGEVAGDAWAGDGLLMRPLVLHASSKASVAGRRRVLHFLFGPARPSHGLRWS